MKKAEIKAWCELFRETEPLTIEEMKDLLSFAMIEAFRAGLLPLVSELNQEIKELEKLKLCK